jgi:hypothetical protein
LGVGERLPERSTMDARIVESGCLTVRGYPSPGVVLKSV